MMINSIDWKQDEKTFLSEENRFLFNDRERREKWRQIGRFMMISVEESLNALAQQNKNFFSELFQRGKFLLFLLDVNSL